MYAKLMSRITESSLMDEEVNVRYAFIMMLAIADPQGYVVGTDVAIARRMNISTDLFKKCVACLMSPDENSNSKEHEGRRVVESDCERGYYLVNYRKYRDTRDEEHRREYMREYMRKRRSDNEAAPVNNGKQCKPPLANAEAEAEGKEEAKAKAEAFPTASAKAATRKPPAQTDDEWLAGLQTVLAYEHLNVAAEFSRAQQWCFPRNRKCTRRFFTDWLNRASANSREIATSRPVAPKPTAPKETPEERNHRINYTERVAAGLQPIV